MIYISDSSHQDAVTGGRGEGGGKGSPSNLPRGANSIYLLSAYYAIYGSRTTRWAGGSERVGDGDRLVCLGEGVLKSISWNSPAGRTILQLYLRYAGVGVRAGQCDLV